MAKRRVSKETGKIVKNYIARLVKKENLPVKGVILYGSRAKGTSRKDSDIDVCVISPKFTNALKAMEFLLINRNREEVMAGLEPVGFSGRDFEEGGSLINEIIKTGVEV